MNTRVANGRLGQHLDGFREYSRSLARLQLRANLVEKIDLSGRRATNAFRGLKTLRALLTEERGHP
jgi:hypothetical protein